MALRDIPVTGMAGIIVITAVATKLPSIERAVIVTEPTATAVISPTLSQEVALGFAHVHSPP